MRLPLHHKRYPDHAVSRRHRRLAVRHANRRLYDRKVRAGGQNDLKKYPNFYRTDRGHFDSAEVLSIVDVAARTNVLTSGEVHYINLLDLKTLHLLKRNQTVKILEVGGYGHYIFTMNVTVPPSTTWMCAMHSNIRSTARRC